MNLVCDRCGKTAKEGKAIGDHCGQYFDEINKGMFCGGKIVGKILYNMEGNRIPESHLHEQNKRLREALRQSVELIKIWRIKAAASSGKSSFVMEEIWHSYFENAPEMKVIREVLEERFGAQQ